MAILVRTYPVHSFAVMEPLYIGRDAFEESEELMHNYLDQAALPDLGISDNVSIEEKKDRIVIKGSLEGFRKSDLDIRVKGDILTLKGERKEEKEHEKDGLYSYTSSYGSYLREVHLPAHVDGKKSSFKLAKGKLEIKLPKTAKASSRQIKIKAQAPKKRQLKTAATKPE